MARGGKKIQLDPAKVEQLAMRGLTIEQICLALGVAPNTLYARIKENASLDEAMQRGRARGVEAVANGLYTNAVRRNNVAAQMFFLKTRGGFNEPTRPTESDDMDATPISVVVQVKDARVREDLK